MNLKQFFKDDDAVSPVIGVILMVAITVILAAVIGTFVLNLGDNLQQTSPTASFGFNQYNDGTEKVTISHQGGDSIPESNLKVTVGPDNPSPDWNPDGDKVSAGHSVDLNVETYSSGTLVKVIWESDDGSNSQTLDEYEIQ